MWWNRLLCSLLFMAIWKKSEISYFWCLAHAYFDIHLTQWNSSFGDQIRNFWDDMFKIHGISLFSRIGWWDIMGGCDNMTLSIVTSNLKRQNWWWAFDSNCHCYFFYATVIKSVLEHWYIVFYVVYDFVEFDAILTLSLKNFLLGCAALTITNIRHNQKKGFIKLQWAYVCFQTDYADPDVRTFDLFGFSD